MIQRNVFYGCRNNRRGIVHLNSLRIWKKSTFASRLLGIKMFCFKFVIIMTIAIFRGVGGQNSIRELYPARSVFSEGRTRGNLETKDRGSINYHLPNNTSPKHYDVSLTANLLGENRKFIGEVKITIHVDQEGTRNIVVHARQLKNFRATLTDLENSNNVQLQTSYAKTTEFLTLTPSDNSELEQGKKYNLTIKYEGKLRRDNEGFYLSSYRISRKRTVYLATTQFESTDARHAFPCYDEPAKRATFTITINHDPSYFAISNMPVDSAKSSEGKTVFLQTPKMSTYHVAFVVSNFKNITNTSSNPPQRVFSRPGTEHSQEFALQCGTEMLTKLKEYFGISYTLPKLDQVAVPDFPGGGMENWGIAIYGENELLYDPKKTRTSTTTSVANIIGHEVAHMWFGNLVTIKWWTYLWLKEGFATLFSFHAVDWVFPKWNIMQLFITKSCHSAIGKDMYPNSRPMTYYVQKPNEIVSIFDDVAYMKSACVLFMWQNALTDQVFRRGLRKYLTLNQFSAADDNMLFQAISDAAEEENVSLPDTISVMMGTWTNQAGAPILVVTRDYETGMVNITQTALDGNKNKLWFVPINYATASNSDFHNTTPEFYIKNDQRSIQFKAKNLSNRDWLILNKQSTGYFSVTYDEKNWKLLTQALSTKPETIHPHNRATLINDAYILATGGILNHSILLNLMTYLRREDQLAPWVEANDFVNLYSLYLKEDPEYNLFQVYIADLVYNIYESLGVDNIAGEHHFNPEIRTIAINLACNADITDCLQATHQKLVQLVEDGIEIETNLESAIYCNALKQATDHEFDFLFNRLMASKHQAARHVLISSLGCAQNPKHIKKFIESSISNSTNVTLHSQERKAILYAAYSRGEPGFSASIDFLYDNYIEYAELTDGFDGAGFLNSEVRQMSTFVTTENQKAKLISLLQKIKTRPNQLNSLEDDIAYNINKIPSWLLLYRDTIINWIVYYLRS